MPIVNTRSPELQGALAAAVGSIAVGFVPFFVTGLTAAGIDTISALVFRYLIALAVLVPLALSVLGGGRGLLAEWQRGGKWLYLNGITLGALQVYCYFRAIEGLATSIVVTIFYCYPVIAIALDRALFGIAVRAKTVLAVGIAITGVALTSLPGFAGAALDPTGLFFACLAPFGYAVYIAVAYPSTKRVHPLASASFIYGALATTFGLVCVARGHLALPPHGNLWLSLLYIGTFGGALQIVAFSFALPRLSSSGYALIVCLEVVTVVLAGVLLLGETIAPVQWLGIVMVLGGILLARLQRAKPAVDPAPTPVPAKAGDQA